MATVKDPHDIDTEQGEPDKTTVAPAPSGKSETRGPQLLKIATVLLLSTGTFFTLAQLFNEGGRLPEVMDQRQVIGTCILFMLVPTYLLCLQSYQRWRAPQLLNELEDLARPEDLALVLSRFQTIGLRWAIPAILLGLLFGFSQNRFVIAYLFEDPPPSTLDIAFFLGNGFLWAVAILMLAWKLAIGIALNRLGRHLLIDLYHLERLRPLGMLATLDVLSVAGSLAFMPLQALDAQFRWENYQWGLAVGVPAALALFLLPMIGVRSTIQKAKDERLKELDAELGKLPRNAIAVLELHSAHQHRIQSLPTWPIDLRLVTRVLVYFVLPPLAWIAAALVEQLLDQLT